MVRLCSALLGAAAWTTTSMWASAVDGTLAWSTLTSLPNARGDLAAAAYGNVLYAMAGYSITSDGFSITTTTFSPDGDGAFMVAYDPWADSWSSMPAMPSDYSVGNQYGGAGVVGSTLFYVGGVYNGDARDGLAAYSIATTAWLTMRPSMYVAHTTAITEARRRIVLGEIRATAGWRGGARVKCIILCDVVRHHVSRHCLRRRPLPCSRRPPFLGRPPEVTLEPA